MEETLSAVELLRFYLDCGVDECTDDITLDRLTLTEKQDILPMAKTLASVLPTPSTPEPVMTGGTLEALGDARALAASANTLDDLRDKINSFQGLAIKRTATQIVFADGIAGAKIMLVGEAPGADEDRLGRPFVGVSGQLLDRMLAAIGLDRASNVYISNVINWRPPGNRAPSDSEIALSLPFIERHIELANPALLVFVGGVATKALMQTTQGITRLRGRFIDYKTPAMATAIPAMPLFHPAYLLRSPAQKGLAWADLLALKARAVEMGLLNSPQD